MAIKYTNSFHCKTLKMYPNWYFWFENMHLAILKTAAENVEKNFSSGAVN
jgi:hypothetical protein